mmetsp:Transcript_28014/g.78147  ORF Transcript_28014/g.78147 Transcript_28014/m.78147 type:complete len:253 (+) Transcript_28014:265-1023(+)
MLEAAHYLQIDPLLRALQDLVARRVDSSNCLEAWSVADRYALEKLSATAMQMALRSFEQVVASPAFLSMPIAFVRALISDDKLIAREEQPVFEAVIRWLHGQESSTFEEQQSLLTLVRFPLLPHYYVISRVQREPIILRHPMGLGLLLESYQQRVYELPDSSLHRRRLGQVRTSELCKEGSTCGDVRARSPMCKANIAETTKNTETLEFSAFPTLIHATTCISAMFNRFVLCTVLIDRRGHIAVLTQLRIEQ